MSLTDPIQILGENAPGASNRVDIAAIFVSILVGHAFSEWLSNFKDSLRGHKIGKADALVGLTFFFTGLRFFIGNQIHLTRPAVISQDWLLWLYDVAFIILMSVELVLLAGVSSLERSRESQFSLYGLLATLYVTDILWIVGTPLVHRAVGQGMADPPWSWAILNGALVIVLLAIRSISRDEHERRPLAVVFTLSLFAFGVDVILIDEAGLISG